jgi:hypothetical protein
MYPVELKRFSRLARCRFENTNRYDFSLRGLIPGENFLSFGADLAGHPIFDPVNRNGGHPRHFGQLIFAHQAAFSYFFNEIVNHAILRLVFTYS